MNKSTITREQLRALAVKKIESLKFAITQSAFTNIRRGLEDELQLAKFALAAMDGEPVAWTWHYREQWHVTNDERRAEFVAKDGDVTVLPLYRHAQQPVVVSDELLNEIDDLLSVCRVYACRSRRNGSENDIPRTEKAQNWLRACRAAMLAAAPQEVKGE